jgi:hypothetical protein
MIDVSKMKHDVGRIHSALRTLPDGSVIAIEKIKGYIPKQFENSGLSEISDVVTTIMVVGLVIGDNYCSLSGLCRVSMKPGDIYEETVNGDRYYVMEFEPGDAVLVNATIPQDSNITYSYYLEFTKFARIPWYLTDSALLEIFDEAKYYTGKATGTSNQVYRVLYSLTQRDPKNLDIPFRYSPDFNNPGSKPKIIGINNPGQLLNATFNRLTSGYMSDNIIAGILNPDDKVTVLEEVMRGLPNQMEDNTNG